MGGGEGRFFCVFCSVCVCIGSGEIEGWGVGDGGVGGIVKGRGVCVCVGTVGS